MRVSVLKDDPGFIARKTSMRTKVLLDGVELKDCVTADEEMGEALVLARDPLGKLLHDGSEVINRTVRGEVKIILPELN